MVYTISMTNVQNNSLLSLSISHHPLSPNFGNTLKPQNYSFEQCCFEVGNKFCSFCGELWKHQGGESSIEGIDLLN